MQQNGPRFNQVVTLHSQFTSLAKKLDDPLNERFFELGHRLGKTMDQLQDIERKTKTSSPIIELIKQWKDSRNGTIEVLLNALSDMDSYEALELVESWLDPQVRDMLRTKRPVKSKAPVVIPTQVNAVNVPQNTAMDISDNNYNNIGNVPLTVSAPTASSPSTPTGSLDLKILMIYPQKLENGWALLQAGAPPCKKIHFQSCPKGDQLPYEFTGNIDVLLKKSNIVVGFVTYRVYRLKSFLYVLEQALQQNKKIVMIHWVGNSDLPIPQKLPGHLQSVFENPVPFIDEHPDVCWQRILQQVTMTPESPSDMFLCYRYATGISAANKIYEMLCKKYVVLQDVAPQDASIVISHTSLFVFILSDGVFQNEYCCQKLGAAVAQNKRILVLKAVSFVMPKLNELPEQWQPYKGQFVPANLHEFNPLSMEVIVQKIEKRLNKMGTTQ